MYPCTKILWIPYVCMLDSLSMQIGQHCPSISTGFLQRGTSQRNLDWSTHLSLPLIHIQVRQASPRLMYGCCLVQCCDTNGDWLKVISGVGNGIIVVAVVDCSVLNSEVSSSSVVCDSSVVRATVMDSVLNRSLVGVSVVGSLVGCSAHTGQQVPGKSTGFSHSTGAHPSSKQAVLPS